MDVVLEFERPIMQLQRRIDELRSLHDSDGVNLSASIKHLELQARKLQERIFSNLTPWQRAQLARHPHRPFCLDYVAALFTGWTEIHGDRLGFDDAALVCGLARFREQPVMVVGHQKGRNTKQNIYRNFGMAKPEGYRKALRAMKLANEFRMPIITFIDTPGAYPGIEAEKRGQAGAIARNIMEMARLEVPIVTVVTGEGGSGGALAIGVSNRVIMLENSVYSVISPEGCAAILWRDRAEGKRAAEALRITAQDCLKLEVVDHVVDEPWGGAHRNQQEVVERVGEVLWDNLSELLTMDGRALINDRYDRFRKMGAFQVVEAK